MIPGSPQILTCPYCGKKKEIMSLVSGNTCGAVYWSDNKRIAPMLMISAIRRLKDLCLFYNNHLISG